MREHTPRVLALRAPSERLPGGCGACAARRPSLCPLRARLRPSAPRMRLAVPGCAAMAGALRKVRGRRGGSDGVRRALRGVRGRGPLPGGVGTGTGTGPRQGQARRRCAGPGALPEPWVRRGEGGARHRQLGLALWVCGRRCVWWEREVSGTGGAELGVQGDRAK